MKPMKPQGMLLEKIEAMEKKKSLMSKSPNVESRIIAISNTRFTDNPEYFIRADYLNGKDESKQVQEYWQIRNPDTSYFVDARKSMDSLKALMEMEEKTGHPGPSTKYRYRQIKDRYDFLMETRKVSAPEMEDRMCHEYLIFLARDEK